MHAAGGRAGRGSADRVARHPGSTLSGISLEAWHRLLPLLWSTGTAFLAGGAAAVSLAVRGGWRYVLPVTAVATTVVLGCAARGLIVLEDHFSLKELALVANRDTRPDTDGRVRGHAQRQPEHPVLREPGDLLGAPEPRLEFATRQLGIGRSLFLSDDEFRAVGPTASTRFI